MEELGIEDIGLAARWSGVLVAITPLTSTVFVPYLGLIGDRIGLKRLALFGLGFGGLAIAALALATSPWHLLVGRMLFGLCGVYWTFFAAVIAEHAPREHMVRAFSWLQMVNFGAPIVAPAMGGAIASVLGLKAVFLVAGVLFWIATALVAILYPGGDQLKSKPAESMAGSPWQMILAQPQMALLSIVLLVSFYAEGSTLPIIPLYLQVLGVAPGQLAATVGLVTSLSAATFVLANAFVGRAVPTRLAHIAVLPGLIGAGIVCVPLFFASQLWHLLVFRPLLSLFTGTIPALVYTAAEPFVPPERRGTGFGLLTSVSLGGSAVGRVAGGMVASLSLSGVFLVDGLLLIGGFGFYSALRRRFPYPRVDEE
jgi:MFS family permease